MKVTVEDGSGARVTIDGDAAKGAVWDGETISARVVKAEPERRYTLNVIYPADKADVTVAADGRRDFARKSVVEDAAWTYMRKHRQAGLFHSPEAAAAAGVSQDELAKGTVEVVESYIYRGPDWVLKAADGSEVVIKAGDWLGGFIWSPDAWQAVLDRRIGGVSPEGRATRRKPTAEALAALRS